MKRAYSRSPTYDGKKYAEAVEYYEKLYALRKKLLGPEDRKTLLSESYLASAYAEAGNVSHALDLFEGNYETKCRILGEKDPITLISLNNVAWSYWKLGDLEKAHELYARTYEMRLEVLGEEHKNTLFSLNKLANITREIGDTDTALELYKKEYDLRVRYYGIDDEKAISVAKTIDEIGEKIGTRTLEFKYRTKNERDIKDKPRVYFTSHPDDFERYFERVLADLFKTQDPAVFYTPDLLEPLSGKNLSLDLGRMNLVVVPVTRSLLSEDNRAMILDIPYAIKMGIPILPIMMEDGLLELYSRPDKFGERQYVMPDSKEASEISYDKKLSDFLSYALTSDELAKRVRAAFDAYIFLSYRKKDRAYANDLMKLIHDNPKYRDIAIWYDEFLSPGESFRDNISRALSDSKLFALLVTPNILESPNFVMDEEYPAARERGKPILPVEMVSTDRVELSQKYADIPEPIESGSGDIYERLADMLVGVAVTENDDDPEHNYLIGLAYYHGIDVEVNRERGRELLSRSAEANYLDAAKELCNLYFAEGNYESQVKWAEIFYEKCVATYGDEADETVSALYDLSFAYSTVGDLDASLGCYERAHRIYGKTNGELSEKSVISLNGLALHYLAMSKYDVALPFAKRSHELHEKVFGRGDVETFYAAHTLARLYERLGKLKKAKRIYKRWCFYAARVQGREHRLVILALEKIKRLSKRIKGKY